VPDIQTSYFSAFLIVWRYVVDAQGFVRIRAASSEVSQNAVFE